VPRSDIKLSDLIGKVAHNKKFMNNMRWFMHPEDQSRDSDEEDKPKMKKKYGTFSINDDHSDEEDATIIQPDNNLGAHKMFALQILNIIRVTKL
jgi:hypothetical protein